MKKQNRNVFAYVRQPNVQHHQEPLMSLKSNRQSSNQTMFNEIVGQMDQQLTSYLNKLVTKNQKQQQKKKSMMQKSLNHERTKSYADILVQTPSTSKNIPQKGHCYRGSHPSNQINNIFFSLNNTPTNQKPSENQSEDKLQKPQLNCSFLQTLDTYISDLSLNKSIQIKKTGFYNESATLEKKGNQKSRENSANQLKVIQKLQSAKQRQKQLVIANRILQSQNDQLKNKLKKNKNIVKTTMQQLYQYAQTLSSELKQQKRQRKKLEQFISQFQQKFIMLRPERKTSGARPRLQDYLLSQTTQQDQFQLGQQCPSIRSKSLKRRKAAPRSTVKHSRVSGLHLQQLSAMLASKNFQFEDEQSECQEA